MYYFDSKRGISYCTQWVKEVILMKSVPMNVLADFENEFHGFRFMSWSQGILFLMISHVSVVRKLPSASRSISRNRL